MEGVELREWEERLAPRLKSVDLIGELSLDERDTAEIAKSIRRLLRVGAGEAISKLKRLYPCTFVSFLVFVGVHFYQDGEYWPAVRTTLKLWRNPSQERDWGLSFEAILRSQGLEHNFGSGHRYVGPILTHGGIPRSLLPRVFDLLHPSILASQSALTAPELIDRWQALTPPLPRPIQRFLAHGGVVAERFVERCREMAREAFYKEFPSAAELGLPPYVVDAYRGWLNESGTPRLDAAFAPPRRPRIRFEPWGEGVVLSLPEQRLRFNKNSEVLWKVGPPAHHKEIPVRVRRVDGVWQSESREIQIPAPMSAWVAELWVDNHSRGTWPIPISPSSDSLPILTFNTATGTLFSLSRRLPAYPLHLLAPPNVQLSPQEALHADLPPLYGEWHAWSAYTLDPTNLSRLEVWCGEKTFSLVAEPATGIRLDGGTPLLGEGTSNPLYNGNLPYLCLPLSSHHQPRHWQLSLHGVQGSQPALSEHLSLDQFYNYLDVQADAVYLPLDKVLPSRAMGTYHLSVNGPLGQNAQFRLTLIPFLTLAGHDRLYLPDPQRGALPVSLLVGVGSTSTLESVPSSNTLLRKQNTSEANIQTYHVEVPAAQNHITLRVIRGATGGGQAVVSLTVPVRRLRWALLDNQVPTWHDRPIRLTGKELAQWERPILLLDFPAPHSLPAPRLRLLAGGTQLRELPPTSQRPNRFWQFDLREIRADVRESETPLVEFCISLSDEAGAEQNISLLHLRHALELERLDVTPLIRDHLAFLSLEWLPDLRLRERQVRLWPLHRPWIEQPYLLDLPDEARGYCELVATSTLSPGHYLAELVVNSPWDPPPIQRPPVPTPAVTIVCIGTLEERLMALKGRGDEPLAWAEQALIHQEEGREQAARIALYSFYQVGSRVPLASIIALTKALREPHTAEVRLQTFLLQRIETILEVRQQGQLPEAWFKWFVNTICGPYLQSKQSLNNPDLLHRFLEARIHATATIQRLLDAEQPAGVKAALKLWEEQKWSDEKLLQAFKRRPHFAFQELLLFPQTPAYERIRQQLLARHPELGKEFIKVDQWVRSQAGWGRITGIRSPTGKSLSFVLRASLPQGYRLAVTLRPYSTHPEKVEIEMGQHSVVRFRRRAEYIFQCRRCNYYATQYQACISDHYKAAHGLDIGRAVRPIRDDHIRQLGMPEVHASPPSDQLT